MSTTFSCFFGKMWTFFVFWIYLVGLEWVIAVFEGGSGFRGPLSKSTLPSKQAIHRSNTTVVHSNTTIIHSNTTKYTQTTKSAFTQK